MSNRSYVCWICREVRRAAAGYGGPREVRCPTCGERMAPLGWKARVPRKDDDRGWAALRELDRGGRL